MTPNPTICMFDRHRMPTTSEYRSTHTNPCDINRVNVIGVVFEHGEIRLLSDCD